MRKKQAGLVSRLRNEWVLTTPLTPQIDVFDWLASHRNQLEKKIGEHANFITACKEARAEPTAKFNELMDHVLNPNELAWIEFKNTLKLTVQTLVSKMGALETERDRFIENTVFSSFSRFIRTGLPKKLE